ncbi:DUF3887 domain-containing protein [Hespellia stercorisuis]|uniref:DUF3887 domain-containing protein n=1 Tax=Hespellia stercorisuis DSM 15480 TaxID=1121950 RepID=A0A1M6QYD4_9FIRM|nr:DUF3887 domain-containing protein [Hespellia stercorisuis]SHK25098.1 Protein of unknown function [Hespellia stercorisuis DSM 15480]
MKKLCGESGKHECILSGVAGKKEDRMKRGTIAILMVFGILLVLLTGCSSAGTELSNAFDEETVKAESMKAVEYFNDREYQKIIDMGNKELKDAITAKEFAKQGDPYLDKDGAFQKVIKTVTMGSENKKTGEAYGGVVMVGQYENGKIQFTIGFDEDMKLVQFNIK